MGTLLRPPRWQERLEPAPAFHFDIHPLLRYFGSVLAARPVQAVQGVFTLEVFFEQKYFFPLSVRQQHRPLHLPIGVRRLFGEIGVHTIAERTGLARELEALLAVNDSVTWSAVSNLPLCPDPQAGALPLPCHSLRIRRAALSEDNYCGLASTESVADLGIPRVLPQPLQVVAPWFSYPTPTGTVRSYRELDWGT